MTKIHITGNAGAGKTTLARELATALSLPVFGLDKVVWQAGWLKTPPEIRAAKEAALIAKSAWVIIQRRHHHYVIGTAADCN